MARPTGSIHAACLSTPRLQRVLRLLATGPHSTRGIVRKAGVMAVPAVVAELRAHGAEIICEVRPRPNGQGRMHVYTLLKAPPAK